MAHPDFVDIPDDALDVNSPGKTGVVFGAFRQNGEAMRRQSIALNIADVAVTSTSYVLVATRREVLQYRADFTGIQRRILPKLKLTAAAAQTITVKTIVGGVSSDEQTHNTTTPTWKTCTQVLDALAPVADVDFDLEVWAKVSGGTGHVSAADAKNTMQEY